MTKYELNMVWCNPKTGRKVQSVEETHIGYFDSEEKLIAWAESCKGELKKMNKEQTNE